ncbi:hybrid signal transduction histidine kinase M [Tanacetum coccineum]
MTNPDQPSAAPTLTLVEKLYAVHNINTLVLEILDLAESNYSTTQSSTSTPPTDDWITADSIVKSWIFLTLSSTLRKRLIKANPKTAKDAWDTIEAIFQDNKKTRMVALKGELRMIQMGDQTADEYFSKFALFRASSHSSLAPTVEIGGIWPPKGIAVLDPSPPNKER